MYGQTLAGSIKSAESGDNVVFADGVADQRFAFIVESSNHRNAIGLLLFTVEDRDYIAYLKERSILEQ